MDRCSFSLTLTPPNLRELIVVLRGTEGVGDARMVHPCIAAPSTSANACGSSSAPSSALLHLYLTESPHRRGPPRLGLARLRRRALEERVRVELVEEHPRRLRVERRRRASGRGGCVPAHVQACKPAKNAARGIPLDAEPLENAVPVEYRHPERHAGDRRRARRTALGDEVVGERRTRRSRAGCARRRRFRTPSGRSPAARVVTADGRWRRRSDVALRGIAAT